MTTCWNPWNQRNVRDQNLRSLLTIFQSQWPRFARFRAQAKLIQYAMKDPTEKNICQKDMTFPRMLDAVTSPM